jgi:hypothetical protein
MCVKFTALWKIFSSLLNPGSGKKVIGSCNKVSTIVYLSYCEQYFPIINPAYEKTTMRFIK